MISTSRGFVTDFYSEKYANTEAESFICCKMTLEHIHNVFDFISTVRRGEVRNTPNSLVFFQVPDMGRVLKKTCIMRMCPPAALLLFQFGL